MDIQKTALRLPKDLHQKVIDSAHANGHSMNAELIARIRSTFDNQASSEAMAERMREIAREIVREELKANQ